jgi:hypothetical protein
MEMENLDFTFTDYYEVVRDGESTGQAWLQRCPPKAELPSYFYLRGFGMCQTTVLRRSAIGDVRFPDNRSVATEDYAFFLSLLSSGVTGRGMPMPSAAYFVSANSRSSNKWRQGFSVLLCNMSYGRLGPLRAFWYWMVYVVHRLKGRLSPTKLPIGSDEIRAVLGSGRVS